MTQNRTKPREAEEERPRRRARARVSGWTVATYVFLTVCGVLLFIAGSAHAYNARGYRAVGGEVFALFLPVLYYALSTTIRDTISTFKAAWNGELPEWDDE